MTAAQPDTDQLVEQASQGDDGARQQLLTRHRDRLRQMVEVHRDRRLLARFDPSDVIQEALAEANRKLDEYLRSGPRRPVAFYPWLRQIAWERLVKVQRFHLQAMRTPTLEEPGVPDLPDESGTSPSGNMVREELRGRVRAALARLGESYREVLVLRYLEELSTGETAAVLGVSEGTVKMRHLRALAALYPFLRGQVGGEE